MHRSLLPVAFLAAKTHRDCAISVILHGSETWAGQLQIRSIIEKNLMTSTTVRAVAVSSFTGGAIARCKAGHNPVPRPVTGLVRHAHRAAEAGKGFRARDTTDDRVPPSGLERQGPARTAGCRRSAG